LFKALEAIVDARAILATNTSSISVTSIGAGLRHPERLAGLHFFNPAPLMALVEVIHGAHTAKEVADVLYVTAKCWGKVPVHARATPGFIVNRVARPFYAEGLRLLDEGAADCATIDALLREAGGFRMGPFELMDLIGHDVNYAVTRSVFDSYYGDQRFTPSLRQLELVEAGFLGRKTGRGFYRYGDGSAQPAAIAALSQTAPTRPTLYRGQGLGELLAQRLEAAGREYVLLPAHADDRIAESDDVLLYRTDGRTATERAARSGVSETILVDLTLEDNVATRLALAAADQADPLSVHIATGLFQAAGYAVSVIDDVPGMVVARVVAMLANEAADAVNQGVCNARDVDLAMRNGVNYPRGPLEWAGMLGIGRIVSILDHLAEAYGEDRYRVSPLLRRKALAGNDFSFEKECP
jgi:3-hydroxybutyryl-CoA dehydrogenase